MLGGGVAALLESVELCEGLGRLARFEVTVNLGAQRIEDRSLEGAADLLELGTEEDLHLVRGQRRPRRRVGSGANLLVDGLIDAGLGFGSRDAAKFLAERLALEERFVDLGDRLKAGVAVLGGEADGGVGPPILCLQPVEPCGRVLELGALGLDLELRRRVEGLAGLGVLLLFDGLFGLFEQPLALINLGQLGGIGVGGVLGSLRGGLVLAGCRSGRNHEGRESNQGRTVTAPKDEHAAATLSLDIQPGQESCDPVSNQSGW